MQGKPLCCFESLYFCLHVSHGLNCTLTQDAITIDVLASQQGEDVVVKQGGSVNLPPDVRLLWLLPDPEPEQVEEKIPSTKREIPMTSAMGSYPSSLTLRPLAMSDVAPSRGAIRAWGSSSKVPMSGALITQT